MAYINGKEILLSTAISLSDAGTAEMLNRLEERVSDVEANKADMPHRGEFTEGNIVIFDDIGNIKDSGVAIDKVYQVGTTWAYIKNLCKLGIADRVFEAGMQLTDHSDKYGDVVFDVVNVKPDEVIIQTHSVIGAPISIGNFVAQGDVSYSSVEITSAIASGEEFCLYVESLYNDSPTGYTYEEYYTATQDIPVGTYDYSELTGNYCEWSSGNNVTQVFTYNELIYDIDDPPAILLADYAASVNADMSEDFQKNVGTGFVPLLDNIGGTEFEDVWQYYKDEGNPMKGEASALRSKGGDWAIDDNGRYFGIQTLNYEQGAYMANAIEESGSHTEIWNEPCGIAPAFKITGGNN